MRTAVVAPAVTTLWSATAVTPVTVVAALPAIGSAVLPTIWPAFAALTLSGCTVSVRRCGRSLGLARSAVTASIAISPATIAATLAGAGLCRFAGRRLGAGRGRGCLCILPLAGALIATLIGSTVTLMSVPAAIGAAVDRATIAAMTPPWPPDLDHRRFRRGGCRGCGISVDRGLGQRRCGLLRGTYNGHFDWCVRRFDDGFYCWCRRVSRGCFRGLGSGIDGFC